MSTERERVVEAMARVLHESDGVALLLKIAWEDDNEAARQRYQGHAAAMLDAALTLTDSEGQPVLCWRSEFEQVTIAPDERTPTNTLMLALIVPDVPQDLSECERDGFAEALADEFVTIINQERDLNGGPSDDVAVSAIPPAQFLTGATLSRFRRVNEVLGNRPVFIHRPASSERGGE